MACQTLSTCCFFSGMKEWSNEWNMSLISIAAGVRVCKLVWLIYKMLNMLWQRLKYIRCPAVRRSEGQFRKKDFNDDDVDDGDNSHHGNGNVWQQVDTFWNLDLCTSILAWQNAIISSVCISLDRWITTKSATFWSFITSTWAEAHAKSRTFISLF